MGRVRGTRGRVGESSLQEAPGPSRLRELRKEGTCTGACLEDVSWTCHGGVAAEGGTVPETRSLGQVSGSLG